MSSKYGKKSSLASLLLLACHTFGPCLLKLPKEKSEKILACSKISVKSQLVIKNNNNKGRFCPKTNSLKHGGQQLFRLQPERPGRGLQRGRGLGSLPVRGCRRGRGSHAFRRRRGPATPSRQRRRYAICGRGPISADSPAFSAAAGGHIQARDSVPTKCHLRHGPAHCRGHARRHVRVPDDDLPPLPASGRARSCCGDAGSSSNVVLRSASSTYTITLSRKMICGNRRAITFAALRLTPQIVAVLA